MFDTLKRFARISVLSSSLTLVAAAGLPATAQTVYDYGGDDSGEYRGESGIVLLLEGAWTNPRNVDNVVATEIGGSVLTPVIPDWSDDLAGRLGFGYQWASGVRVMGTVWGYQTDLAFSDVAGPGRQFAFAIGPPASPALGATGTTFAVATELEAATADIDVGKVHGIGDAFSMTWSVGLRYASYEETHVALYDNQFVASKQIQSDMVGARAAVRANHRRSSFSVDAGLGVSLLSGEMEGRSGLSDSGVQVSGSAVTDDGRSGSILDFDVNAVWHVSEGDRLRVYVGWEQQTWRDLVLDVVRNFPDTVAPLRDRDSITFQAAKVGVRLTF